jgi:carotenoid phi-ring synthase / carotenoid chi-ring synthase
MSDQNPNLTPNQFSFSPISRRTTLKILGVGAISTVLGYSRFVKPKPNIYQPDLLDLPRHLSQTKTVTVIGGGLAGLASAYELSQRGFQVTLLEKSPQLGGKIASWKINVNDNEFKMEHGFHGFFPQYYNLKSLVSELEIKDNFLSLEYYSVVFNPETTNYQPEVFRPSNSAFPWNIVDLAISSPNRFKWGINLTKLKHLQVFEAITSFKMPKTYDKFDHLTVSEWVKNDFPQGLYDLYFLPFAKSSLNAPDTLSAGELLQFFHFYFFGNPEGLAFNGTRDDMGTSLVDPIANSIINNGGNIITEATVSNIYCENNQIKSITYQQGNNYNNVPFWVNKNDLLSNKNNTYYGAGDKVFIANNKEAISLTCSHQGCTVAKQEDGSFICPCHGAKYDQNGKILKGPATRDLGKFKVKNKGKDKVELIANNSEENFIENTIESDYYIIATDVPGVKNLFNLVTGDNNQELSQKVAKLAISDPFAVARFWLDKSFEWEHSWFTSLSGYALTDSITLYHKIQRQFIDWAEKTGGSVVELHAYCYKEKEFPTQGDLLNQFEQELYQIVPELKQARILHQELVNQKNFSGFPPNSYGDRPVTKSEIENLYFAGDWVKMPFPCGLMERAVSSGVLAANEILHQEGLKKRTVLTVNPEGLLKI